MSTRRISNTGDKCPLTDVEVLMALCQQCPYFRGASSVPGMASKHWSINCNWPRNGSYIAPERPGWGVLIPDAFREAFAGDD